MVEKFQAELTNTATIEDYMDKGHLPTITICTGLDTEPLKYYNLTTTIFNMPHEKVFLPEGKKLREITLY